MGVPSGLLNRRVMIMRRALMPVVASLTRAGFTVTGEPQWGGLRPKGTVQTVIGGLPLVMQTAVVTLRENNLSRSLSVADQIMVDGKIYDVLNLPPQEKRDGTVRVEVQEAPTRLRYAQEFDSRGETVTVRRPLPNGTYTDAIARAIVTGYRAEEVGGGIDIGHRRVILSAEDLDTANWPVPPQRNDRILRRGNTRLLNVLSVDESTHTNAGTVNGYEIQAAGL